MDAEKEKAIIRMTRAVLESSVSHIFMLSSWIGCVIMWVNGLPPEPIMLAVAAGGAVGPAKGLGAKVLKKVKK